MPQRWTRSAGLAACLAPMLALAPAAIAGTTPLIDTSNGFVQVNGTTGTDTILMASTSNGGILVLRIARGLQIGFITPEEVQTLNVVVFGSGSSDMGLTAPDGDDYIDASSVAPGVSLEIYGQNGDDTIYGSQGPTLIDGGGGNDTIYGEDTTGSGNDNLNGGLGFYDRIFAGPSGANMVDPDGVAEVRGSDASDNIAIFFDPNWVNRNGRRRLINKISAGGGDDTVFLIAGPDDPLLTVTADGDGQGTTNPGSNDFLDVEGNIDNNPANFPNFP